MVEEPWVVRVDPADPAKMAFALPDKPSIAVLPFDNMSDEPGQEWFADGMTDDLITDLSQVSGLFVIARNSTFTYKGKPVKVQRVAEELGVRYVLEGSVRRAGDQVRINVQLVDAVTGRHLWADRFDGSVADVFALQDKVTRKIVTALSLKLAVAEEEHLARPDTDNADAYDSFLQGWELYRRDSADDFAKAVPHFEKAIELAPSFGRAHAALAAIYWRARWVNWVGALGVDWDTAQERAKHHLEAAMRSPSPLSHQVASSVLVSERRHDETIAEAEQAIALDASDPAGYLAMGESLIYAGRPAEGSDFIAQGHAAKPPLLANLSVLAWV